MRQRNHPERHCAHRFALPEGFRSLVVRERIQPTVGAGVEFDVQIDRVASDD